MEVTPSELTTFLNDIIASPMIRERRNLTPVAQYSDYHVIKHTMAQIKDVLSERSGSPKEEAKYDDPPPYHVPLTVGDIIAMKPTIDLILSHQSIGVATYTMLHPIFKTYYRRNCDVCTCIDLTREQKYFLTLFYKIMQLDDLLAMDGRGLLRQLVDGPKHKWDTVDLDMRQFYHYGIYNAKFYYAPRAILPPDILLLREIKRITLDELNQLWASHPVAD